MESSKIRLRYRDRDVLFKKEYSELKIKVALNWFEIIALLMVTFSISIKVSVSFFKIETIIVSVVISLFIALAIAFLFSCFRKYQLRITRFDKEHIYKKISKDLIDETKSQSE